MAAFIRRALKKLFPNQALLYEVYRVMIRDKTSYLYLTGWMQSQKVHKPIDRQADPIPWMNFPVVRLLDDRLTKDMVLFEFGSGYSTYFFARRVRHVTSVESDEKWFARLQADMPANVVLIYKDIDVDGEYCRTIGSRGERFDLVVVDGRDRVNCLKQSISVLTSRGVIVFDDSERDRYQEGIDFAEVMGFRALNIEGLKAMGSTIDRTTILYRDGNCLGL